MNDFQKTVNLKDSLENKKRVLREQATLPPRLKPSPAPVKTPKAVSRAESIDQVYKNDPSEPEIRQELQKISQPEVKAAGTGLNKNMLAILAAVFIVVVAVFFLVRGREETRKEAETGAAGASDWYAVELINGETYYGQIDDLSSDPVVIKNVYYNYDQLNPPAGEEAPGESGAGGNLRLVKRGKETHGPDGSMSLVRTQVVFMEPLREDSKVLRAILDYEK